MRTAQIGPDLRLRETQYSTVVSLESDKKELSNITCRLCMRKV